MPLLSLVGILRCNKKVQDLDHDFDNPVFRELRRIRDIQRIRIIELVQRIEHGTEMMVLDVELVVCLPPLEHEDGAALHER